MQHLIRQKYTPAFDKILWANLIKNNTTGFSTEEIVNGYQGFEGDIVELFEDQSLEESARKFNDYCSIEPCTLLAVIAYGEQVKLDKYFTFQGYDYGACNEDKLPYLYSSIFNEVLYGGQTILHEFRSHLNEHFLFPNAKIANDYAFIHASLEELGCGVERLINMQIYEIWKYTKT